MLYWVLIYVLTFLLDIFATLGVAKSAKDLEIILLRQQVRILQRKTNAPPCLARPEKLVLATLTARFRGIAAAAGYRMSGAMLIFKPETVLRWHRELVRRKWTFKQGPKLGRPRLSTELEALIVQLARENPRWGYDRIEGELLKLGYVVSTTSVRNVMKRNGIVPAPNRGGLTWRAFIAHHKAQFLACDFFTVETIWLQTLYVLFFIELGTRRMHFAGCTTYPNTTWSHSRRGSWCGCWKTKRGRCDSSSMIVTPSSHDRSTQCRAHFIGIQCLNLRTSRSSRRRFVLQRRTPTRSAGCARPAKNVSTSSQT